MTARHLIAAEAMSAAATAFLGSLEPEQRAKACFAFPANDERRNRDSSGQEQASHDSESASEWD